MAEPCAEFSCQFPFRGESVPCRRQFHSLPRKRDGAVNRLDILAFLGNLRPLSGSKRKILPDGRGIPEGGCSGGTLGIGRRVAVLAQEDGEHRAGSKLALEVEKSA